MWWRRRYVSSKMHLSGLFENILLGFKNLCTTCTKYNGNHYNYNCDMDVKEISFVFSLICKTIINDETVY